MQPAKVISMNAGLPAADRQNELAHPPRTNQKKVLCFFDFNAKTGYGSVTKNMVTQLRHHFDASVLALDIVAINYLGNKYEYDAGTVVISAQGMDKLKDPFGRTTLFEVLKNVDEYDGLFILQDVGIICPIVPVIQKIFEDKRQRGVKLPKTVFYFPVDCPFHPMLLNGIEFFDTLICYNEYGRSEVLKARPELAKKAIRVIAHGINTRVFTPLGRAETDVENFRRDYFGDNADKYIINATNRNQPRKGIPNVLLAFDEYRRLFNPHAYLYLHYHPHDPQHGFNIPALAAQLGLREGVDYGFPKERDQNGNPTASDEQLNQLYNASDVFLTMNHGEGWGLTVVEAMAARLPVIAPLHTSMMEISADGKRIYALEEMNLSANQVDNVFRWTPDYREAAEKLDEVYRRSRGSAPAADCVDHMHKLNAAESYIGGLDWHRIGKQWMEIFKTCF